MKTYPKVLRVETGNAGPGDRGDATLPGLLDYGVYESIPRWWRRLEEVLRLDIYLAFRAKAAERHYDVVWAGSEKVGIPLSFMGLKRPLVVVAHHPESKIKARVLRATGIARRWAAIGYLSTEGAEFLIRYLGVSRERLFSYESAKYLSRADLSETTSDGPILSAGVAKRDYRTLINALSGLEGYETELLVSSKFGDRLNGQIGTSLVPHWVRFSGFVAESDLVRRYQRARFVVVPLEETNHNGAGINVVLEAGAFGKAVIATKTGGMPTFVKDGETGILVPPHDVGALQDALRRLWTDPGLADRMGRAGRRYVETHFDPSTVNARIAEVLYEAVANWP